jgi:RNase adaptor protein for sRNA GlmZ degradation
MSAAMSPQIVFITGTSGSGKTTLFESLRGDSDLSNTKFYDIDEGGTPPVGRESWRKFRVANLLFDAMQRLDDGQSTVICGLAKPSEILEFEHFRPGLPVSFLLIEASDDQISERLEARAKEQTAADIWNENIGDIKRMINQNVRLKPVLRNAVEALKHGYVIDASELSAQALHDQTKQLIIGRGESWQTKS